MIATSTATVHYMRFDAPAVASATELSKVAPARSHGRAAHFIDIENLCSTSDLTIKSARHAMREYHATVRIADGDHVIVAASHHNAIAAWSAWRGARLLAPRSGPDGADHALREAIRTERIAERFTDVYLGSGDGGFMDDLAFLAGCGSVTTHVVAHREHLSRRLRLAAHDVITLTDHIDAEEHL